MDYEDDGGGINRLKEGCRSESCGLGVICGVEDAIGLVDGIFRELEVDDCTVATNYEKNFGIWFRGQANADWELEPWVFRESAEEGGRELKTFWEETSMFHHFQLRVPEYHSTYRSTFDWLCLMQHYNMPTRLLDWTESVLVALFFAVGGEEQADGRLFALDVRRLNYQTSWPDRREKRNLCKPDSLDAAARSQLAKSRNQEHWQSHMNSLRSSGIWELDNRGLTEFERLANSQSKQWLETPVAVLPRRLNARMISQSSTFTIHGGKKYKTALNNERTEKWTRLAEPRTLDDINEGLAPEAQFLKHYVVPKACKEEIKSKLFKLGIHHGSLFPELDGQARYMSDLWRSRES
jgi:hypothetical protein